ncbi:MAG: alkene reductase [Rubrivivax sp.]|jgi:N-ethylmaleimide reductase|nr:alkene reductase [Rubrivivax sp.]
MNPAPHPAQTTRPSLFDPLMVGELHLQNRVVMAPLTRNRAPGTVPTAMMATYYAQRADPATGAGLIISEASQISPQGQGYQDTPGIFSSDQVAAWRVVTDAVHQRGGLIACQLWHVGRISHERLQPGGGQPVSSSARTAASRVMVDGEFIACSPPRALRDDELPGIVADYAHAARCAMDAGFDAVEVHAANGYLLEQFLRDSLNDREGAWGGGLDGRTRLLTEVLQAVAHEAGSGRTGLRLSPVSPVNGLGQDSQPQALYEHVLARLAPLNLAFAHLVEGTTGGARDEVPFDHAALRRHFAGAWVVNNGYTREMALQAVEDGRADAVAFGRPFIANPDLGWRLRHQQPWADADRQTFYRGGERGYTDYPAVAPTTSA